MCRQISIADAKYFFHEVTPQMMDSNGFPVAIKKAFIRATLDDFYKGKQLAFAAFDDCLYVLLVSFYSFKVCEITEFDLMKILDICQDEDESSCGVPSEVDLDRLHKYQLKLANAAR